MVNHWRIHSLTSKVSLIFLLYTLFVIWKVFYVEFSSEIPRAMSLNRQVLVVTMTLMSHKFLLKGSWGAGVCCWDYFGALTWYHVEEIFVAPDFVNPLSISVQANGLKRDLFWIWGMLICIQLNRSLIVRACVPSNVPCPKTIMLFPLIWKQAITILIFFRIVTNIWLFRGILAQGRSDIFNLRFCLLCFLVHLLFSQGFSNLWKPSGEDKEFQSLYLSMTALGRVPRWILLRLTVPLFAQIFHTVSSKFTKKSSIGSPRENFLGLAIILTLKRGSVSQAVDP